MTAPPITDWIHDAARTTPDAPALVDAGGLLTYRELDEAVDRAADALAGWAAAPGVRVGIVADRNRKVIETLWGVWRCGATAVVLDAGVPPAQRERQARAWGLLPRPDMALPLVGVSGPEPRSDHHTWVPTSGSSGAAKPVILTRANVAAAVAASQRRLGNVAGDAWLLVLPLFHVGGLSVLWRSAAAGGAVILHEQFDGDAAAAALETGQATFASVVPTMLRRMLAAGRSPSAATRAVLLGGAGVDPGLVVAALDAGYPVLASYGLTEACSQVATVVPGTMRDSMGTAGTPLDGVEVSIRGATDSGVGEIVVDGPTASPGYGLEPRREGPLLTGDLGRCDDAGRLVVLGRKDDLIITGGENVSPVAVEAVLLAHPQVTMAAVYGLPDPEWGAVVAASVTGDAGLELADLNRFLADRAAPAQRPRLWRIVDRLPLLPNGKIDRAKARQSHRNPGSAS